MENKKDAQRREQKLLQDLGPNAQDNSLTIEFEQNRASQLNDSGKQWSFRYPKFSNQ